MIKPGLANSKGHAFDINPHYFPRTCPFPSAWKNYSLKTMVFTVDWRMVPGPAAAALPGNG